MNLLDNSASFKFEIAIYNRSEESPYDAFRLKLYGISQDQMIKFDIGFTKEGQDVQKLIFEELGGRIKFNSDIKLESEYTPNVMGYSPCSVCISFTNSADIDKLLEIFRIIDLHTPTGLSEKDFILCANDMVETVAPIESRRRGNRFNFTPPKLEKHMEEGELSPPQKLSIRAYK